MAGRVGGDPLPLPVVPVAGDALDAPEPPLLAGRRGAAPTPPAAAGPVDIAEVLRPPGAPPPPPAPGPALDVPPGTSVVPDAASAGPDPASDPSPTSGAPRRPGPRVAAVPEELRAMLGEESPQPLRPVIVPVTRRAARPPPPPPSTPGMSTVPIPTAMGPAPTPPRVRDVDPDTVPDTPTLVPAGRPPVDDEGDAVPFLPAAALGLLGLVVAGVIGAGLWSWIHRPEAPPTSVPTTMAPLRVSAVPASESPTPQPAEAAAGEADEGEAPEATDAAASGTATPPPTTSPRKRAAPAPAPAAAAEEEENPWLPKEGASEASPPAEVEPKKKGLFGKKKDGSAE